MFARVETWQSRSEVSGQSELRPARLSLGIARGVRAAAYQRRGKQQEATFLALINYSLPLI